MIVATGCAPADTADARSAQPDPAAVECRVSRISDGDSFHCGATGRVRLLMIDAPELAQGEPGREAKSALETLAPVGSLVTIETDVRPRDDYQRLLAYAYLKDGRMLNEEMARSGYVTALVYPPNVKYAERIRKAVGDARKAKRGLWSTDFFECAPRDYRAGRCGVTPKS
ncbi:MAG: thermonuclease family protein [Gemmatimonadaceae bacterium]